MNYIKILQEIPKNVQVVAVSKYRSLDQIQALYEAGCRDFGENRVNEALEKSPNLPSDIKWHFIGSLQKNKVNKVIGRFHLIHSVDTFELAEKISKASQEANLITSILLQVNTSGEISKQGLSIEEWRHLYNKTSQLEGINIKGLMTMAPLTQDEDVIRNTFRQLKQFSDELKLPIVSMGMSQDYKIAIQEGATLLRIGTALFS